MPKFASDNVDGDRQFELRRRGVRIFAVFDGLLTDLLVVCFSDLGVVDGARLRPYLV